MDFDNKKINSSKRITVWTSVAVFLAYAVCCFLLSPLLSVLAEDVVFADTILPMFVDVVKDAIEIAAISVCYSAIIYCIYCFGSRPAFKIAIVFFIATFFKYTVNVAVSWMLGGEMTELWAWDIVNIVFYTLLESAQLIILFFISKGIIEAHQKKITYSASSGNTVREKADLDENILPFKRLYDRNNCLIKAALVCGIVTAAVKSVGMLLGDLWLIIAYGAPKDPMTIVKMLLNYASGIIPGVLCYFVIWIMVSMFSSKFKTNKAV